LFNLVDPTETAGHYRMILNQQHTSVDQIRNGRWSGNPSVWRCRKL